MPQTLSWRARDRLRVPGAVAVVALSCASLSLQAASPSFAKKVRTLEGLKETIGLAAPRAFLKGDNIRLFFTNENRLTVYKAGWHRARLDARDYTHYLAELRLDPTPPKMPDLKSHWREAKVYSGDKWRLLAREAAENLTPREPGRGCYLQFANSEHVFYRDDTGKVLSTGLRQKPPQITIDQRFNAQEFATVVTHLLEARIKELREKQDLLLFVEPREGRAPRFVLFDLAHRRCVLLLPPRTGDDPRGAPHPLNSLRVLSSLLLESHGLAILKNPVSSLGRLVNTAFQVVAGLLRLPQPAFDSPPPALKNSPGMDLDQWEKDLDGLTGTYRDRGSVSFLIDGEQFFPAFQKRLAEAGKSLHIRVCIFDNDDVAVEIADLLKNRSAEAEVKVLLDRMSSQASGMAPPAGPLPEGFVPPRSIGSYLEKNSRVAVRPFLNTWFTADHTKVFIIDEHTAYLGGMNLGREYRYEWHDLMVEVEGPVVAYLERDFQRAWAHASALGDLAYAGRLLFGEQPQHRATNSALPELRRLYTRTGEMEIRKAVLAALGRARNHVCVENPYLYDRAVVGGLVRARRRGVDVRVVMPAQNDSAGGESSNYVTANYLLRNGVRVFIYPGMTHVKAILVDGWACFGSANFNRLSLRTNQEANLATSHRETVRQLREQLFEVDFAKSYELTEPITVSWTDHLAEAILDQF